MGWLEGLFPELVWCRVRYAGGADCVPDLSDWPELDEVIASYLEPATEGDTDATE